MKSSSGSDRLAIALATWFGCGYFPVGPGTVGSLGGIVLAWPLLVYAQVSPVWLLLPVALFYAPGVWSATRTAQISGRKDPSIVVIDEVLGQWLTMAGALRITPLSVLLAFVLFRALDIWKPYPARQLEALPAGTGIIADDLMAGVYGAIVLAILGWCNLY